MRVPAKSWPCSTRTNSMVVNILTDNTNNAIISLSSNLIQTNVLAVMMKRRKMKYRCESCNSNTLARIVCHNVKEQTMIHNLEWSARFYSYYNFTLAALPFNRPTHVNILTAEQQDRKKTSACDNNYITDCLCYVICTFCITCEAKKNCDKKIK